MTSFRPIRTPLHGPRAAALAIAAVAAVAAVMLANPAAAERADRGKKMVIEADKPGSWDVQRQAVVFNGNVVVAQGTMVLRAERIETRETADGYRTASAIGSAAKPATWRQRRDNVDETVEGSAERIDFDDRADTLRLRGNASVRTLRGNVVANELTGAAILWDNATEVLTVEGGATSAANPGGRVRAVLSPRAEGAASAASAAPGRAPLAPSRSLGEPR